MACRSTFKILRRTLFTSGLFMNFTPFVHVKCCSPTKEEETKFQLSELATDKLSFEYMIKQSALDSVNNVSKMITVTYTAVENTSKEYRDLLLKLINLTRESFMFDVGDDHWDEILRTRSKLQHKKRIVTELTQYMDFIHKMATATTEICYSAGMENLSHSLNERVDDALNKVKSELQRNTELEAEYTDIQEQSIEKYKKKNNVIAEFDEN